MRKFIDKVKERYKTYSDKRFSTIAGTLVYFLLMSVTPFALWLTLVFGNLDVEPLLSYRLFESVSPFLHYLKSAAESAAGSAGIIFLLTSLYSSTNFFYHLRRSGEIIYDSPRIKGGIKLRFISLALILAVLALFAVLGAALVSGTRILESVLPQYLSGAIVGVVLAVAAFLVALLLNVFACPYKLTLAQALPGSLFTTGLWIIFAVGFGVYMNFANPERLYGKIAFIIVFLLWSYVMMCCFVVGMINNGTFAFKKQFKKL